MDPNPNAAASSAGSTAPDAASRLRRVYVSALAIIAVLTLASQGLLGVLVSGLSSDATIINVAGAQRMLSQRLASQSQQVAAAAAEGDAIHISVAAHAFEVTLDKWTDRHRGLRERDAAMNLGGRNSPEVMAALRGLEADHVAAVRDARALASLARLAAREPERAKEAAALSAAIIASTERYVPRMHEVVGLYEREAREHVAELSRVSFVLDLTTLVVLGLVAGAVFEPAVRRLRGQQAELRRATERFELAVRGTADGLWDRDLVEGTIYYAPRFKELLGFAGDDPAFGESFEFFHERVHPDDVAAKDEAVRRAVEHGEPYRAVYRARTKAGDWRWFEASGAPYADAEGRVVRMAGAIHDITEARETQEQLYAATHSLEEANSLVCLGSWSFDAVTSTITWSRQLYRLFGRREEDGPPNYAGMLSDYDAESGRILSEAVTTALRDGTPYTLNLRTSQVDGVRHVRAKGHPRRDATGAVVGLFGIAMDVTAEVEREEDLRIARNEAEAASRSKSAFLANMSHEIRTPLTAILGFADLLREDGGTAVSPERARTIDTITNAGAHLLAIINDILDLSKIEADRMTVERIDTPVAEILREVVSLVGPRATGKGVALEASLRTPVPERVLSDPTRLRQILMNLAGNAAKFTEAGRVSITAGVEASGGAGERLVIDIEDTGPGMTAAQAERLFQSFGQADETVTRKHGGTGLGLTICRRLATLMSGDVVLVRTAPGAGSCFRLILPLEPAPGSALVTRLDVAKEALAARPASKEKITLQGRILLAEDGPDNQRLVTFHLKKAGAEVDVAENGVVALTMIAAAEAAGAPYDLLLTDMQMPEMDGYTLARTLRDAGSTLPIVALTAHSMAEDRERCTEAGCNDYATKPIDKESLLRTTAEWLGKKLPTAAPRSAGPPSRAA